MRAALIRIFEILAWIAFAAIIIGATARGFTLHGMPGAFAGFFGGLVLAVGTAGAFIVLLAIHDHTRRAAEAMERLARERQG